MVGMGKGWPSRSD